MKHEEVFDVVVVGGGLAGICAAIASARNGAQTALIEQRPVLGGNSSSEYRITPYGAAEYSPWSTETGIVAELMLEERARSYGRNFYGATNATWDLILYHKCITQSGLRLFLNTVITDVTTDSAGRITCLEGFQIGSEKRFTFRGEFIIDATGDGTVGALAGAGYMFGREGRDVFGEPSAPAESDRKVLGSSLLFRARNVGKPVPFEPPDWIIEYPDESKFLHRDHRDIEGGYWWIEIAGDIDPIGDNEELKHELLRHVLGIWDHIKNHGSHGAENYALEWVGMLPAKRESRRLIGDYVLRENDLRKRTLFPDRVAYGGWTLDVHSEKGILDPSQPPNPFIGEPRKEFEVEVAPYSIPLRSLYSKDICNLYMAGRDISASHIAFASTRVMLTCAVIGQAAGTAAAVGIRNQASPREVAQCHIEQVQQILIRDDCYIPHVTNRDPGDLARLATVTATSQADLRLEPTDKSVDLGVPRAVVFPFPGGHLEGIDLFLQLEENISGKFNIPVILCSALDIWDIDATGVVAEARVEFASGGPARVVIGRELPEGAYILRLPAISGVRWYLARRTLPGVAAAQKPFSDINRWRFERRVPAFALVCDSSPFAPRNVISGVSRPERLSNIWVSDPKQGLPQMLELAWEEPQSFNEVHLTFDTNLSSIYWKLPGNHRAPECIRDYELEVLQEGSWKTIASERGNYQRKRVHRFDRVTTTSLRLKAIATNGAPEARVYEIRVYDIGRV